MMTLMVSKVVLGRNEHIITANVVQIPTEF